MSLQTELQLGERAARLLEDETFMDVINTLKDGIMSDLVLTGSAESSKREALYFEHKGLDSVLTKLKALADGGTYAKRQLHKS